MRQLLLTLSVLTLAACGGGGGGGDATPRPVDPPTATTPPPPAAPPPPTATPEVAGAAGIDVPDGFDFSTSSAVPVHVDLGSTVPAASFLTVCHPEVGTRNADYSRCVLRARVDGGSFDGSVQLPNHVDTLVATLWRFNPATIEAEAVWERASGETVSLTR
ncbi:MAG: hypothetical protein AAFN78_19470 [Pseudomonadota bacterium]